MPHKYIKRLIWIVSPVSLIHGPGMAWKLGNCPRNRYLTNTPALARVLPRIYCLGEKSRVAEGHQLPRGVRGHDPPPPEVF